MLDRSWGCLLSPFFLFFFFAVEEAICGELGNGSVMSERSFGFSQLIRRSSTSCIALFSRLFHMRKDSR